MKIEHIAEKTVYYFDSEFVGQDRQFKQIPNGYIDKTICGCGLTSVALENNTDTIIAVPTKVLVDNKVSQYPNERFSGEVFGVYGGVTKKDIENYLFRRGKNPIKIIVTYDSLNKVAFILDMCKLVIDESDSLLRGIGIKLGKSEYDVYSYLMSEAEKRKDKVSFISATPIPLKYLPKWVSDIPQIKFIFSNQTKVQPILMKRTYPYKSLADELIRPLKQDGIITLIDGITFKKVIVFMNSVENIKKTIKDCSLSKDDVTILCGDSAHNDYKIRGYNRLENPKQLTKYTFITSSGFQGIDLYDNEAINIVVSNTTKDYQMIDLTTDMKQAISRNRTKENPNYNRYIFIYNQNNFEDEEVLELINNTEKRIKSNCNVLNEKLKTDDYLPTLETFRQSRDFIRYSLNKDGKHSINELAFNADKYFIEVTRKSYKSGFDIMSKDNGSNTECKPIQIEKPKIDNPFSYNSLLKKYSDRLTDKTINFTDEEKATDYYKLIDSYYKRYKKLESNASRARKLLNTDGWNKVVIEVRSTLTFGKYKWKTIKDKLQQIYTENGVTQRKPKKEDLYEFGVRYTAKKIHGYDYIDIIAL